MNAGLSNLATLKAHLLAASMLSGTDYDTRLTAIGLGVAALFENYCNRKFAWQSGEVIRFTGARDFYSVPRFPIATLDKVETRNLRTDPWVDVSDREIQLSESAGLIYFDFELGELNAEQQVTVQLTVSGGYWWEQAEPDDDGYPSDMPSGGTALPDDLRLAFLLQCAEIWNKADKLGAGILAKPDEETKPDAMDFPPLVKQLLRPYQRIQAV